MESHTKRRENDSENIPEERESSVLASAKIEITVNDFYEWVRAYPKEEYPKIMMPRSETKITAELDFFDSDFLEYLVSTEDES